MNSALQIIGIEGQHALIIGFVVFLRVGAAMALLPAFGEQSVPQRIRLVLSLGFTAIVAPAVASKISPAIDTNHLGPILLATEVLAGLVLGIALRLFVLALQIAGSVAAQATSLSQMFGGSAGVDPQPAIGHIMTLSGLTLAVMAGLHVRVVEIFIMSYDFLPAGHFPEAGMLSQWGISRIAKAFAFAFTLAAPFVIASLIYNVALGVINRAMPQLQVAFVGAPAITAGGLFLLLIALPVLLSVWSGAFSIFLLNPFGGQ